MKPSITTVKVWSISIREVIEILADGEHLDGRYSSPDALTWEVRPGEDGTGVLVIRSEEPAE